MMDLRVMDLVFEAERLAEAAAHRHDPRPEDLAALAASASTKRPLLRRLATGPARARRMLALLVAMAG